MKTAATAQVELVAHRRLEAATAVIQLLLLWLNGKARQHVCQYHVVSILHRVPALYSVATSEPQTGSFIYIRVPGPTRLIDSTGAVQL